LAQEKMNARMAMPLIRIIKAWRRKRHPQRFPVAGSPELPVPHLYRPGIPDTKIIRHGHDVRFGDERGMLSRGVPDRGNV
jgi:hypothetical protein